MVNQYIQSAEPDHSGTVDECPVCCPNIPDNYQIPVMVPPPQNHYHHCPECYEVFECGWKCTLEPDQDDPDTYPGQSFGAIIPCFTCQKKEHGVQVVESKEWWDKYHGFTK